VKYRLLIIVGIACLAGLLLWLGSAGDRVREEAAKRIEKERLDARKAKIDQALQEVESRRTIALALAKEPPGGLSPSKVLMKTNYGDIEITLFKEASPGAVSQFVHLVREGFYEGLRFYVKRDFALFSGDPKGDGTGDPGYCARAETRMLDLKPGIVLMAPFRGRMDRVGSQFLIYLSPVVLPKAEAIAIGYVSAGMETIYEIEDTEAIKLEEEHDHTHSDKEEEAIEPKNKMKGVIVDITLVEEPEGSIPEPQKFSLPL